VGQLAADSEFAISEYGGLFLNGTFGWPGGLAANAATPAYAVATPGFRLRTDPLPQLYFQAAVFDGNPDSFRTDGSPMNNNGTHVNFNEEEGLFSVYELGYKLNQQEKDQGLPGTYKMGGWWHSDIVGDPRFDSAKVALAFPLTGEAKAHDGIWGVYGIVDQMVWREPKQEGDQGLGLFYRVMGSPGDRSTLEFYTDGGLNYKGLIPGRDDDLFGIGVAYGQMGGGFRGAQRDLNWANALTGWASGPNPRLPHDEMVIETTYQIQLTPWCYLQPDFQYIIHPGGSAQLPDAVVIGMRTGLVF
jgi:porin